MNLKEQWKNKQLVLPLLVLILCMATAFFFCVKKAGFHEDEYYTYYSTARSTGFFVEDGKWMPAQEISREYTVLPGEGFHYGLVKLVQSWDVHPPLFYFAIHTMESLVPSTLSKWTGLSVNLIFFLVDLILLYCLSYRVLGQTVDGVAKGKQNVWACIIMAMYGLSAAGLSSVTLIRMYAMLVAFILWVAILHVKALGQEQLTWKSFYIPLAICTFLGFMTQYYYFIFLFFLAAVFCLYRLLVYKKWLEPVQYGATMVLVFGLAYCFYPAYPSHMFHGQRGGQATSNFLNLKDLWHRMYFFGGLVDKMLFSDCMLLLFAAILLLIGFRIYQNKKKEYKRLPLSSSAACLWMLGLVLLGFFLVVSKTGLLVGAAAIRYMLPICPILVMLVVVLLVKNSRDMGTMKGLTVGLLTACFTLNLLAVKEGAVLFLYPEDAAKIVNAKEWAKEQIPVAYAYDSVQSWCIWDSSNELLEYPEIYLFEENREEITLDKRIKDSDQLILYASTVGDAEACLAKVMKECPQLSTYELQYKDNFCNVYYLH